MSSWLKTKGARAYLSVGSKLFENIVRSGDLTYIKLPSGHRRFHTRDLDSYMRKYEVNASTTPEVKAAAERVLGRL